MTEIVVGTHSWERVPVPVDWQQYRRVRFITHAETHSERSPVNKMDQDLLNCLKWGYREQFHGIPHGLTVITRYTVVLKNYKGYYHTCCTCNGSPSRALRLRARKSSVRIEPGRRSGQANPPKSPNPPRAAALEPRPAVESRRAALCVSRQPRWHRSTLGVCVRTGCRPWIARGNSCATRDREAAGPGAVQRYVPSVVSSMKFRIPLSIHYPCRLTTLHAPHRLSTTPPPPSHRRSSAWPARPRRAAPAPRRQPPRRHCLSTPALHLSGLR